jgi:hypothetical protein
MRWEVTYARFIKSKYDELKVNDNDTTNSSSEDTDEIKIQMQVINGETASD